MKATTTRTTTAPSTGTAEKCNAHMVERRKQII